MGEAIVVLLLMVTMVAGPLVWRGVLDRQAERALQLEAEIRGAARRALGGESLLSVRVEPPGALHLHPGRVRLSAPHGWESLIEPVWQQALEATPEDYELVLAAGREPESKEVTPVA